MTLPSVKGFLETSFIDWPGRVASVVFLPGCNFRCPYCHNHQLILQPEQLATWPLEDVLGRLEEFRGWIDGVCVTGGEPTIHGGLPELLRVLRSQGWGVKLDTNGSRPTVLEDLLAQGLVEAVGLDVKAPLESVPYRRNAGSGSDPDAVARTLELLAAWGGWVDVRTTIHPAFLSQEELRRVAFHVGRILGTRNGNTRFTPQRCRPEDALDPAVRDQPGLSPEAFRTWEEGAREAFEAAASDA